jgi:hypothetical protein
MFSNFWSSKPWIWIWIRINIRIRMDLKCWIGSETLICFKDTMLQIDNLIRIRIWIRP